jgi:crotonobetainyl-CoA:carnitine CoA-transferase CaiB-like acyl-CoA transferase
MTGGAYMSGTGEGPIRAAVPFVDFTTAVHCAFGTLAALMHRARGGGGQIVEGQLLGSALTLNNALLMEQAVLGRDRVPTGNRGQTSAPSDLFRVKDGWLLLQVVGQPLYERWAKIMGEPHWLTDPRFKDDLARGDNAALISARTQEWCKDLTTAEAIAILEKARIPSAPVYTPQQALDDPHVQAMGYLHPVDFPGLPRSAPVAKAPVRLGRTPTRTPGPPPRLGADTDAILGDLGYDGAAIARLRQSGVV